MILVTPVTVYVAAYVTVCDGYATVYVSGK